MVYGLWLRRYSQRSQVRQPFFIITGKWVNERKKVKTKSLFPSDRKPVEKVFQDVDGPFPRFSPGEGIFLLREPLKTGNFWGGAVKTCSPNLRVMDIRGNTQAEKPRSLYPRGLGLEQNLVLGKRILLGQPPLKDSQQLGSGSHDLI